ncbi:MAG: pyridoxal 5'-phosphate synthase [Dermatophilaceae bacterium]|nr:pyridoxal 5'-phosphate synthase [Intrasporangiaceae bacterium]
MSDLSGYPRTDYNSEGIDAATVAATPWQQIRSWVAEAIAAAEVTPGFAEPTAVSVATVDVDGVPNVRTVLARFLDDRGPGFVSSLHSTKAAEIAASSHIALAYTWPGLFRAIRFRGVAESIGADELLDYWRTRPYGSQIAACASLQSHPIESREALETSFEEWAARYPESSDEDAVPMPEDFCGWRVRAHEVELWAGRRSRLHDRIVYTRVGDGTLDDAASWAVTRRQP